MTVEKIEKKEESLNQGQINDLFRNIILGKDVTEIIHTSRGDFKVKFPRTRDIEEIGRRTAIALNGIPIRCFDQNTYNLISYTATLDVVVIDYPDWYKLAKKENEYFSWADIPDEELIREVYALAYSFRQEVQDKIRLDKKPKNIGMDADTSSTANSEPGLFDGIEN